MLTPIPFPGEAGIWRTSTLKKQGNTDWQVRSAVSDGRLRRVRRGWLADAAADPQAVRAVALGGVVSCVSALALRGAWTMPTSALHVRRAIRVETRSSPGVAWCPNSFPRGALSAVDDVPTAIATAVRCVDAESAVVAMDSILRLGLLDREGLAEALHGCESVHRNLLDQCDWSDSGTESLVRVRLRAARIKVRPQVQIDGVGRVDMVVGDTLVLEIDSRRHHTGADSYQRDRRRDRRLTALGFTVLRVTYEDVMFHWDDVLADILAVIRTRRHRHRHRHRLRPPAA